MIKQRSNISFYYWCSNQEWKTHPLNKNKLSAANESTVDPRSFLSEHADTLLQPPLLHLRWHVIL